MSELGRVACIYLSDSSLRYSDHTHLHSLTIRNRFWNTKHSFNASLTKVSSRLVRKVPVTWDKLMGFLSISGSDNLYIHACMCVHVLLYVCVYVCMNTCMYTYMYVYVNGRRTYICISECMLVHVRMIVCIYVCRCVCMCFHLKTLSLRFISGVVKLYALRTHSGKVQTRIPALFSCCIRDIRTFETPGKWLDDGDVQENSGMLTASADIDTNHIQ